MSALVIDRNADIRKLYRDGVTLRLIAERHGITKQRVQQIIVASGLSGDRKRGSKPYTEADVAIWRERLERCVAEGHMLPDIARVTGFSYGTVQRWAKLLHIDVPKIPLAKKIKYERGLDLVREGQSTFAAARVVGATQAGLYHYCKISGVKSHHETRNPVHRASAIAGAAQ